MSHRGLSGIHNRVKKITTPSTAPIRKAAAEHGWVEQHDGTRRTQCGTDPEAAVDHQIRPAANAPGNELVDGRVNGSVFSTDSRTGNKAEKHEAPKIPREGGCNCGDQVYGERDEEELLASQPVGEPTKEQRSQHRTGQVAAVGKADVGSGEGQSRTGLECDGDGPAH